MRDEALLEHLARAEHADTSRGSRLTGTVKFFIHAKGYGFLGGDNGSDYFVHISDVTCGPLSPGDSVEFWTTTDTRTGRVKAVAVSVIE
jgi:cold shock protein